jgi:hypothetical protein
MLQPFVSNALRRVDESAKVPSVIVFHTGTSAADLTKTGGTLAEGAFLSFNWFCKTSRAVH